MLVIPKTPALTGTLARGLLAHFPLSEGAGRGANVAKIPIYDSRGNLRLDWACNDTSHPHISNDYGLYFDGSDSRVFSTDATVLSRLTNPGSQVTIAAWIYTTKSGAAQYICDLGDGGGLTTSSVNYRFRIEPGGAERLRFSFTDGTGFGIVYPSATVGPALVQKNRFMHVAVTVDLNRTPGDRARIYHDSQNIKALTYSALNPWLSSGNVRFAIGSLAAAAGSGWFQGNIRDLMVWNRWLSADEIDQIYGLGARNG